MEPQQQQPQLKNLLLFLFLSAALLFGWMWLSSWLWPQPEQAKKKADEKLTQKDEAKKKQKEAKAASRKKLTPAQQQTQLLFEVIGLAGSPWHILAPALAATENKLLLAKAAEKVQAVPVKTFALGNANYFLRAKLTTQGAGVQQLTLTRFQEADWYGRPVFSKDGSKTPLDLIPDDPDRPSFLMFHYPDPKLDQDQRPVVTLGKRVWKLERGPVTTDEGTGDEEQSVTFTTEGPPGYEYLQLRKTFTLRPGWYHLGLRIEIIDTGRQPSAERRPFRYQLAGARGLPIEGGWYNYIHRNTAIGLVDPNGYVYRTLNTAREISWYGASAKVPEGSRGQDVVQYGGVLTQYFASVVAVSHDQAEGTDWHDIVAWGRATPESEEKKCHLTSVNLNRKIPTAAVRFLDDEGQPAAILELRPQAVAALNEWGIKPGDECIVNVANTEEIGRNKLLALDIRPGRVVRSFLDDVTVRMVMEPVDFKTGGKANHTHTFILYHGPVKVRLLDQFGGDRAVDPDLVTLYADTLHLDTLADYQSAQIWKTLMWTDLLIFITRIMHWLLNLLYSLIHQVNPIQAFISTEALSILLLTILVRGAMFPVSRRAALMSVKMQALAPEMKKIQEKYKDDLQARNQAVWELYRRHKVNPMGGCLPLFLQLPIFLGLYYALQESLRFRLAPFLWIQNLAAPDMLIYWGQSIPWLTDPDSQGGALYLGPFFNLLPVIAVGLMMIQQKLTMPPPTDEQQEMQQKMMKYMMIVFGLMFYKVAAGLCLYFIASTLWGVAERKLLPKKKPVPGESPPPAKDGAPPPAPTKPKPPGGRKKDRKKKGKQEEPETAFGKVKDLWEEILKQAKKK
jgi:YidC/Oxa1 family membrane protein insertase